VFVVAQTPSVASGPVYMCVSVCVCVSLCVCVPSNAVELETVSTLFLGLASAKSQQFPTLREQTFLSFFPFLFFKEKSWEVLSLPSAFLRVLSI